MESLRLNFPTGFKVQMINSSVGGAAFWLAENLLLAGNY